MQYRLPRLCTEGTALERNQPPAHAALQEIGVGPLGLHCDHPGSEPHHGDAAVADMRADVENKVAGADEAGGRLVSDEAGTGVAAGAVSSFFLQATSTLDASSATAIISRKM